MLWIEPISYNVVETYGTQVHAGICVWSTCKGRYSICECVLPDSDVRMNVSWENSGGDQAVSGVRSYKRKGYLVFLAPSGSQWQETVSWCYHNVCFKPSHYCSGRGGNTCRIRRKSPFRNNPHFSASLIPVCTQLLDVFSPTVTAPLPFLALFLPLYVCLSFSLRLSLCQQSSVSLLQASPRARLVGCLTF